MSRSQLFIAGNFFLLILIGIIFLFATKPLRKDHEVKIVSTEKETRFRAEAVILDSLYKNYIKVKNTDNQIEAAKAESLLSRQFQVLKKQYTGKSSPATLAAKLIRNYEVRVLINQRLLAKKSSQSDDLNRAKELIKELEEVNLDLKSKNQSLQQAVDLSHKI